MNSPDSQASLATAIRVLEAEADAIRNLVGRLGESFLKAVDLTVECTGKIAVTGLGKSGEENRSASTESRSKTESR